MAALSEFLSHIYTMTTVFLTLLFLEVVILFRSLTGKSCSVGKPLISTTQYLQLIEQDNPTISYSKASPLKPESGECSVCLSEFEEGEEVRNLQCNHTFHKNCLDKWLQQYLATCPLCRKKVLPEEVTAKYHRLGNEIEYDGSDEELIFLLSALHGNSMHRFF